MAVTRLTKYAFRQGFAAPLAGLARTGDKPASPGRSHPEHPEPGRLDRRVERGRDPPPQHAPGSGRVDDARSEEHTSELQSLMRISYADFSLTQKKKHNLH